MVSSTYFSPKSVLGTSAAVTFFGIESISSGLMPRVSVAPLPSDSALLTWPTMTPRTLTSARIGSCIPAELVVSVTGSNSTNFWVKAALTSQTLSASRPMNAIPRIRWWSRGLIANPPI